MFSAYRRLRIAIGRQWEKVFGWLEAVHLQWLSKQFREHKIDQQVKLQPLAYDFLDEHIMRQFNCKSYRGMTPGHNLIFISGLDKVGKTHFINKAIRSLLKAKARIQSKVVPYQENIFIDPYQDEENSMLVFDTPNQLLVHLDMEQHEDMSFYAFLHLLEQQTIKKIIQAGNKLQSLSIQSLCSIALHNKGTQYLTMYLKDYMMGLLNDVQELLIDESTKENLQGLLEETVIGDDKNFKKTVTKMVEIMKGEEIPTALNILLSVFKKIQYEHRPKEYSKTYYRTGIEGTEFLFDIINYLTGFHKIKAENRTDSAMILSNLFKTEFANCQQFLNWYDHLVLRLYDPNGLRSHFPVIMEVDRNSRLRDTFYLGRLAIYTPLNIELTGYRYRRLDESHLLTILKIRQLNWLYPSLGAHPYTWRSALTEMSNGTTINKIKNYDWYLPKSHETILRAKINKVFTNQRITKYRDEQKLRWRLAQQLEILHKCRGAILTERYRSWRDIAQDPVSQALEENGVTYNSVYFDIYHMTYQTDTPALKTISKELIGPGFLNGLQYRYWKWFQNHIPTETAEYSYHSQAKIEKGKDMYSNREMQFTIQEYFVRKERFQYESKHAMDNRM